MFQVGVSFWLPDVLRIHHLPLKAEEQHHDEAHLPRSSPDSSRSLAATPSDALRRAPPEHARGRTPPSVTAGCSSGTASSSPRCSSRRSTPTSATSSAAAPSSSTTSATCSRSASSACTRTALDTGLVKKIAPTLETHDRRRDARAERATSSDAHLNSMPFHGAGVRQPHALVRQARRVQPGVRRLRLLLPGRRRVRAAQERLPDNDLQRSRAGHVVRSRAA